MEMRETIREMVEDIVSETPEGQRAISENRLFLVVKRQKIVAEIAAIREQQEAELPTLRHVAEESRKECEAMREKFRTAELLAAGKASAALSRSLELSSAIDARQAELQATCDPAIQKMIDHILARLESTRHTALRVTEERHSRSVWTDRRKLTISSNAKSIERWMMEMRQAIQDLQGLKLLAVDDLPARLKVIKERVVEADRFLREDPIVYNH